MNKHIEIILNFRKYLLLLIADLSVEELNTIPQKFNNNIIWNLAHMNAVLQALCYKQSEIELSIDEKHFLLFLPGTIPSGYVNKVEVEIIKKALLSSCEILNQDLEKDIFKKYTSVPKIKNVYNISVTNIEDALKYIIHHEGIHYNAIINLKKEILKSR